MKNLLGCLIFVFLCSFTSHSQVVEVPGTIPFGYSRYLGQVGSGCDESEEYIDSFTVQPFIPDGATLIGSTVTVSYVDDEAYIGTNSFGADDCGPNSSLSPVDITAEVNSTNGSFTIELYDSPYHTGEGPHDNEVRITGENTYSYEIDTIDLPPLNESNTYEEVCFESGGDEPCGNPNSYEICVLVPVTCSSCSSRGSPVALFNPANFNFEVEDIPVWANTGAGQDLKLKMRYSQYANTNAGRSFGPRWACNWNSQVESVDANLKILTFPSGSIVEMTNTGSNIWSPPGSLSGTLIFTNGVYEYHYPAGRVYEYTQSSGNTNIHLLSEVRDAWDNTVSISYTNDRIFKVEQTTPASGRFLEFSYSGTNTLVTKVQTDAGSSREALFTYSGGLLNKVTDQAGYLYEYTYTNGYLNGIHNGGIGGLQRLDLEYSETPDLWTKTNRYSMAITDGSGRTQTSRWTFGGVEHEIEYEGTTYKSFYQVEDTGSRGYVVTRKTDSGGISERYEYGTDDRLDSVTDKIGNTVIYTRNAQNQTLDMTDELANVWSNVYAANGVDLLYTIPPEGPVQEVFTYVPDRFAVATASNVVGRVLEYQYNTFGQIVTQYDGRTEFVHDYDTNGYKTATYRNSILIESNLYDSLGRRDWTRNAAGLETTFYYDDLDRLIGTTYDNQGQISSSSNIYDCCFLSETIDRNGRSTKYEYNDLGWMLSESNAMGLVTYYEYDPLGNVILSTNSLTYESRSYSPEGELLRIEPPPSPYTGLTHAQNFVYDEEGRLQREQSLSGAFTRYEYDAKGRQTAIYAPSEADTAPGQEDYVLAQSNRYDALDRLVWTMDQRGHSVSNNYDALGRLITRTEEDGDTEHWSYNEWGDLITFTNALNEVRSNRYDNVGRLVEQTDPRQVSTHYTYNAADFQTSVSNEAFGYVWSYQHDEEGRIKQIDYPDQSAELRFYDPVGNVTQMFREGVTTLKTYDEQNAMTSLIIGGNLVQSNRYDALGRMIYSQGPEGMVVTNQYDSWSQLQSSHYPQSLTVDYDYSDRGQTNLQDRLNLDTFYTLDPLGRQTAVTDPENRVTQYAYATNGTSDLIKLTDPENNETQWEYDEEGNLTKKIYADSSDIDYLYDALNRLTNTIDTAGNIIRQEYDANGNLTELQHGQDAVIQFDYDLMNRRTNMVDAVGTTRWTYDTMSRVTSEENPFGITVDVLYDDLGRMTNLSFNGESWTYHYDDLGRITGIDAPEGLYDITWYGAGRRKQSLSYPSGLTTEWQYDNLLRVTNMSHGTLLDIDYQYDDGDRRTNETWNTQRDVDYSYDDAGQLLGSSSTRASDNSSYGYDFAGNPTNRTVLGLTFTNAFNNLNQLTQGGYDTGTLTLAGQINYPGGTVTVERVGTTGTVTAELFGIQFEADALAVNTGSNQYEAVYEGIAFSNIMATSITWISVGDTTYTHDDNGNLTSDGKFTYQYNDNNRLTNVINQTTSQNVFSAIYDGIGRRLEVTRNGTVNERYVYYPNSFLVLAVLDETNGVKQIYTHGPDLAGSIVGAGGIGGILSEYEVAADQTRYLHSDVMGNVVLVSDDQGGEVATYQYSPFGQLLNRTGEYFSRFVFSSKEYDSETGLYNFGYRYYSPIQMRWLTRDPIAESGGINLYRYIDNDTMNSLDPLGLRRVKKCEAFLYIGHQNDKEPHEWDVDECATAGGLGCFPKSNNLPEDDFRRWPDLPTHNHLMLGGWLGTEVARNHSTFMSIYEDIPEGDPRVEHDFAQAVNNALSKQVRQTIIDDLCKKCCKKITFIIEIGKDKIFSNEIKNAVKPHGYKPGKTYKEVVTCSEEK